MTLALMARRTMEKGASGTPQLKMMGSIKPRTTIADIVSLDRKYSKSGLYSLDSSVVRPLEKIGTGIMLARTKGLTKQQELELSEQNVEIVHVREIMIPPWNYGVITSRENAEMPDTLYNTEVVPYVVLNKARAESVLNMASQLPEPEKKAETGQRPENTLKIPHGCWNYGYAGC